MAKQPSGFKEFVRKRLVSLKRKPQTIAFVVLILAFIYYSFNLTNISNTTARVNRSGMGLCEFTTMLFSILSMVSFLNAFPHRKKVNVPMLAIMFVMLAAIIFCDVKYGRQVSAYMAEHADESLAYILRAKKVLKVHIVILAVGAGLVALLPVYRPMIKRINTSVEVEGNGGMTAIDISGEDA